jgi:hypothetical protein
VPAGPSTVRAPGAEPRNGSRAADISLPSAILFTTLQSSPTRLPWGSVVVCGIIRSCHMESRHRPPLRRVLPPSCPLPPLYEYFPPPPSAPRQAAFTPPLTLLFLPLCSGLSDPTGSLAPRPPGGPLFIHNTSFHSQDLDPHPIPPGVPHLDHNTFTPSRDNVVRDDAIEHRPLPLPSARVCCPPRARGSPPLPSPPVPSRSRPLWLARGSPPRPSPLCTNISLLLLLRPPRQAAFTPPLTPQPKPPTPRAMAPPPTPQVQPPRSRAE